MHIHQRCKKQPTKKWFASGEAVVHVQFRDNPVTVAMPQHVEIQRQINMLKGIIISLLHHYLPERSRTLRQLLDTIYVWAIISKLAVTTH
jgi:hypothetical protein